MLLFRIHELAVRFLVPPGVTEIRVHEEISLMHVAIHALARRNRAGELVHDRMSALGFRNRFVSGETQTLMSKLVPPAGIRWRTIVGVNNVAGRATARSIIARMIVRPEKSEEGVVQPCFLQSQKNRIGAVQCSETAFGKTAVGFAIRFRACWQSERKLRTSAFFENAQNVSGITEIESRQWFDERQNALNLSIFRRNGRVVNQLHGRAIRGVGLTKAIIFLGVSAIII